MKGFSHTSVRVEVDGTSILFPVSRRTTCDDVIMMVVSNKQTTNGYALYESRDSSEKMVAPSTRILKLIRSWGVERGSYSLVVKPCGGSLAKSRMASITKAKKHLQRLRSVIMKDELTGRKLNRFHGDNLLHCDVSKSFSKDTKDDGLNDLNKSFAGTCHSCFDSNLLPARTCGDGADDASIWRQLPERERRNRLVGDDLNTGFIADDSCVFTDDTLNEGYIDYDDCSDSEAMVTDDISARSSVCDLERNIVEDCDITTGTVMRIKDIFSRRLLGSEDDALESFMHTFTGDHGRCDQELFSARRSIE